MSAARAALDGGLADDVGIAAFAGQKHSALLDKSAISANVAYASGV
jgi:hypothetical protein